MDAFITFVSLNQGSPAVNHVICISDRWCHYFIWTTVLLWVEGVGSSTFGDNAHNWLRVIHLLKRPIIFITNLMSPHVYADVIYLIVKVVIQRGVIGLPTIEPRGSLSLVFHHSDLLIKVFGSRDVYDFHFELFVVLNVLVFALFALVSRTPFERPVLGVLFTVVLFPAKGLRTIIIFIYILRI